MLYNEFSVPGRACRCSRRPSANFNPWTEAKVDHKNPDRGPMLIAYGQRGSRLAEGDQRGDLQETGEEQRRHRAGGDRGRGHGLTIGPNWRGVCDTALKFVQRFV